MIYNMVFSVIILSLMAWSLSKKPGTKDSFFANTVASGVCVGVNISDIIINGFDFIYALLGVIGLMFCIFSYVQYQNCNWKW